MTAPIPPHERAWRHPSELGPTGAVVEPSSTRSRALAFSSGAIAAVLVAVMVVSVTPRRSGAPSAVGATTIPPVAAQPVAVTGVDSFAVAAIADGSRSGRLSTSTSGVGAALVGAPHAISATPTPNPSTQVVAAVQPAPDDPVLVLTASYAHQMAWSDVDDLLAPDGAVVVTLDGELVAVFVDGVADLAVDD